MYSRTLLSLFSLFFSLLLAGQEGASVQSTVNKNRVMLGEPFEWKVTLRVPRKPSLSYSLPDSIPPFEKRGAPRLDSQEVGEFRLIKAVYTLMAFDSGHWILPSVSLGNLTRSDTLGVDVYFTFTDTTRTVHDLKEIVTVPPAPASRRWWLIGLAALLLAGGLFYFLRRKRPVAATRPVSAAPPVDPFAEALDALQQLRAERPDNKAFYTRLIDIFRWYVFRRHGLLSLQQTTDDLVRQLEAQSPGRTLPEQVARVLHLGDMAKFARYESSDSERAAALETMENYIRDMEKNNRVTN